VGIMPFCVDENGIFRKDYFYYVCGLPCEKIYQNEVNNVSQICVSIRVF
jgi:hypothetical protein